MEQTAPRTSIPDQNKWGNLIRRSRLKKFLDSPASLNIMYLPALILFAVFIFYPLIEGIKFSFTDWNGYSDHYSFVGLDKYRYMFSDMKTRLTIVNTLIYGLGSTLFQNIFGLAYALFLNNKFRGRAIVRTIVYFSVIISPLIMGYIFYFVFQYDRGALNDIMKLLNLDPVDWLGNGKRAVWLITFVNTFQYMGVSMVVYLAGLQAVPKDYLEAAEVDGASGFEKFIHVTLPLLMPAITISIVLNIIEGLKLFDIIMSLTRGGPGYASHSLSSMMYDLYFSRQDAGFAAALGILMFVLISAVGLTSLLFLRKKEVDL
ncbi:MAG: sugar ABC transporter permease [Chloroflexota bacterium]|nr:MAG: sugar ABC transporter permease [Chloroflexota bacterium]